MDIRRMTGSKSLGLAFCVALLLLSGCRLKVDVPYGGSVTTLSGNHVCEAGRTCLIDISDYNFDEVFVAEPEPGYEFVGWKKGFRRFCGGSKESCSISTLGLEGNEGVQALLDNPNELFYLIPLFSSVEDIDRSVLAPINKKSAFKAASALMESLVAIELAESVWYRIPGDIPRGGLTETINGFEGGTATARMYYDSASQVVAEVTYNNFRELGRTVNGRMTQTWQGDINFRVLAGDTSRVQGFMQLQDLRVTTPEVDFSYRGRLEYPAVHGARETADMLVTNLRSGRKLSLIDFSLKYDLFQTNSNSARYPLTEDIKGYIQVQKLGRVYVQTKRPLRYFRYQSDGGVWSPWGSGLLEVTGRGGSMRFQALNERYAAMLLDRNRDGLFELSKRLEWTQLLGSKAFTTVRQGRPPYANPGVNFQAGRGQENIVFGSYSSDPDNDWLSMRWDVAFAPIGSELPLTYRDSAEYGFKYDQEGDYVFKLSVSDGESKRENTVAVSTGSPKGYEPVTSPLAALEVSPATSGKVLLAGKDSAKYGTAAERDSVTWGIVQRDQHPNHSLTRNRDVYNTALQFDPALPQVIQMRFATDFMELRQNVAAGPVPFFPGVGFAGGEQYLYALEAADFDGDGTDDLIVVTGGSGPETVEAWITTGPGTREVVPLGLTGSDDLGRLVEYRLEATDLNEDGRVDIVVLDSYQIQVAMQGSDGQLEAPQVIPVPGDACGTSFPARLYVEDLIDDGTPDIIVPNCGGLFVWSQDADRIYQRAATIRTPVDTSMYNPEFGDLAGDGLPDLTYGRSAGFQTGEVVILVNNAGNFEFDRAFTMPADGSYPAVHDINGDGLDDMVLPNSVRGTAYYRQVENRELEFVEMLAPAEPSVYRPRVDPFNMLFGDFDSDGDTDFASIASDVLVWTQTDSGFPASEYTSTFQADGQPALFDFNGDGFLDILAPKTPLVIFLGGLPTESSAP